MLGFFFGRYNKLLIYLAAARKEDVENHGTHNKTKTNINVNKATYTSDYVTNGPYDGSALGRAVDIFGKHFVL